MMMAVRRGMFLRGIGIGEHGLGGPCYGGRWGIIAGVVAGSLGLAGVKSNGFE
jgi:hypothetical protein